MGESKAYPAPTRVQWCVMIEHLNGTQIVGTSDEDVLERWRSLHWASPTMTPEDFKERVAGFARVLYRVGLIGVGAATSDEAFLDALAAEGVIHLVRK